MPSDNEPLEEDKEQLNGISPFSEGIKKYKEGIGDFKSTMISSNKIPFGSFGILTVLLEKPEDPTAEFKENEKGFAIDADGNVKVGNAIDLSRKSFYNL